MDLCSVEPAGEAGEENIGRVASKIADLPAPGAI